MEKTITYNLAVDDLFDVLNYTASIPGLSHAWEEDGVVLLAVVDGWTGNYLAEIKQVCREFGYYTVRIDEPTPTAAPSQGEGAHGAGAEKPRTE